MSLSGQAPDEPAAFDARHFWEDRLGTHPDLRGTGETGLSLRYNRACYALRERVLDREIRRLGLALSGTSVLDVGSGVGFFVDYYRRRGARVTGVELTDAGARVLARRFPETRILVGDVADLDVGGGYGVVNAFDVLYHIVDDERWERALSRLARALAPDGVLFLTDVLRPKARDHAAHNVMRGRAAYERVLGESGLRILRAPPTHYFLNRDLGWLRGLNRLPALLQACDETLLRLGVPAPEPANRLLVARRQPAG